MISKEYLLENYIERRRSVSSIAKELGCSQNKANYWLQKFEIPKRTVAEAAYAKHNPDGDPFCFSTPQSNEDWFLYGLGLGLFWGEGNKVNRHAVRLGNTDPGLIRMFLDFLVIIFRIDESRLRFGLQIFSDVNPRVAQAYWCSELAIKPSQFQKIVVTKSRKAGTYRYKNQFGVLTIYFSNTKIRDTIVSAITALQQHSHANVAQLVERIHGKSQ